MGLAASGKYPGTATLLLAIPVAMVAPRMWLGSLRWPRALSLEREEIQQWVPRIDVNTGRE